MGPLPSSSHCLTRGIDSPAAMLSYPVKLQSFCFSSRWRCTLGESAYGTFISARFRLKTPYFDKKRCFPSRSFKDPAHHWKRFVSVTRRCEALLRMPSRPMTRTTSRFIPWSPGIASLREITSHPFSQIQTFEKCALTPVRSTLLHA